MPSNNNWIWNFSKDVNKFNNFIPINKINFNSNFPECSIRSIIDSIERVRDKENRIKYSYPFSRFHQHPLSDLCPTKKEKKK